MRIINFGSLNIDYVYKVEHFVQPGETISSLKLDIFCGGKGLNQSIALARSGTHVYHAGKIGNDGEILKECLKSAGIDTSFIGQSSKPSGHAIIQVDDTGQNCILLHSGANSDFDERFIDNVIEQFSAGDIILLQNEINKMDYIMEKAYKKGLIIAFNPSPINKSLADYPLKYVTWFILNEIEGYELTGKREKNEIADILISRYPACKVVLTLGKNGVLYKDAQQVASHGVFDVKVVDTTAAGDTFTGYFLAGIMKNVCIDEILKQASIASSITVSRMGASAAIPTMEEVLQFDSACPFVIDNTGM